MKHLSLTLDPTNAQPPTRDSLPPHSAGLPASLPEAKETKVHPKKGVTAEKGDGEENARLMFVGTATTIL